MTYSPHELSAQPQQISPAARLLGHRKAVNSVSFSPNGRLLASAGADRVVALWDVTNPARPSKVAAAAEHRRSVRTVAFNPDGFMLASGGRDRTVHLWNVSHARLVQQAVVTLPRPGWKERDGWNAGVHSLRFSPDGLLLACGSDHAVTLWLTSGPYVSVPLATLAHRSRLGAGTVMAVAFCPYARLLVSGSRDAERTANLWDLSDLGHPTARGTLVPLTRSRPKWWNRPSGEPTVNAAVFSPRVPLLATANGYTAVYGQNSVVRTGSVTLWDVADPDQPKRTATFVPIPDGEVSTIAISPDGRTLASAGQGQDVTVWDITDPSQPINTHVLKGHRRWVQTVAFSPDGRTVASGSLDKHIMIWQLTS